jgi:hypothetical protein
MEPCMEAVSELASCTVGWVDGARRRTLREWWERRACLDLEAGATMSAWPWRLARFSYRPLPPSPSSCSMCQIEHRNGIEQRLRRAHAADVVEWVRTTPIGLTWNLMIYICCCHRRSSHHRLSASYWSSLLIAKGPFGFKLLKFNSHHINVPSNARSTKYRLIACMSAQTRSNLRDESIKPN